MNYSETCICPHKKLVKCNKGLSKAYKNASTVLLTYYNIPNNIVIAFIHIFCVPPISTDSIRCQFAVVSAKWSFSVVPFKMKIIWISVAAEVMEEVFLVL